MALLVATPVWAATGPAEKIARLLANLPEPGVECGALVVDLETGQTVFELNANTPLLPASSAKLFVLAAAIDQLGPDFVFRTRLAKCGPDLVLIGDGDPALGDPRLAKARGEEPDAVFDRWAADLISAGLSTIDGDLILDDSIFDDQVLHPEWDQADHKKWYAAPVGGLNFNDNCVDITLQPAARAGDPPSWTSVPRADLIQIVNRCKSGGQGQAVIDRPKPECRFVVTGRCNKPWPFPPVPAPDPGMLTASALQTGLRHRGIHVTGQIVRRRLRAGDGTLLAECQVMSETVTPLADVLTRTGKNSQNMFAEALMKRLGYRWASQQGYPVPQGSWDTGRSALLAFLHQAKIDDRGLNLVDGSGLARKNRTTAAAQVALLRFMYRHPQRDLFVASLSRAGHDGTLRKRLKGLPGSIHAKTGLLRGVRALSGYAVTPQGRWRAFCILFNGFKGRTGPFNDLHDKICRILAADSAVPSGSKAAADPAP